ncbi:MAG: FAD-binding oxidoreductase [Planctomycetota bacterium]|nr:FAD-binding oxidoreductase [Planctomycetota bacterium]
MTSIQSVEALADLLRSNPGKVRIAGSGSRCDRVRPRAEGTNVVSLDGLNQIERLEADDLTCSVQPGVRCSDLAKALAEEGLELGFDIAEDKGTIGGLFATDPLGPANVGAPSPRSILLGVEAVLSNGASFRSGARVVKSVAGFDVHRLLVGSEGRLYAAVLLHLKLRSRPQASSIFSTRPEDFDVAQRRFMTLRSLAPTLQRLMLRSSEGGYTVEGRCAGRASFVTRTLEQHDLTEIEQANPDHLMPTGREIIAGIARPSRLQQIFELLPPRTAFLVHGGGHFEADLEPDATDRLFAGLEELGARARVVSGARHGHNSAEDPATARLSHALQEQLDPLGVFA